MNGKLSKCRFFFDISLKGYNKAAPKKLKIEVLETYSGNGTNFCASGVYIHAIKKVLPADFEDALVKSNSIVIANRTADNVSPTEEGYSSMRDMNPGTQFCTNSNTIIANIDKNKLEGKNRLVKVTLTRPKDEIHKIHFPRAIRIAALVDGQVWSDSPEETINISPYAGDNYSFYKYVNGSSNNSQLRITVDETSDSKNENSATNFKGICLAGFEVEIVPELPEESLILINDDTFDDNGNGKNLPDHAGLRYNLLDGSDSTVGCLNRNAIISIDDSKLNAIGCNAKVTIVRPTSDHNKHFIEKFKAYISYDGGNSYTEIGTYNIPADAAEYSFPIRIDNKVGSENKRKSRLKF